MSDDTATAVLDPPADETEAALNLDLIIDARVAKREAEIEQRILQRIALSQAAAQSKPSLTMQGKPGDRFITESGAPHGATAWIKHYRCDTAVSTKLNEIDMDLLDKYMNGELERPIDDKGRPYSDGRLVALCEISGQYIPWVDGHCYAFTENQVRNVERVQELAERGVQGGMAGIYEDFGGVTWNCQVCPSRPTFVDKRTWEGHMLAIHGVNPQLMG